MIEDFYVETNDCTIKTRKSDMIMNKLFTQYIDKIINGVINSSYYAFYRFGEVDDLRNEARMKIYDSIKKKQWNPEKGATIFSFLSTVAANNIRSYTLSQNRNRHYINEFAELDKIFNNHNFQYREDNDKFFIIEHIFDEIYKFFDGKPKFQKLGKILKDYYYINMGKKFIKKDFIEYARTYTFSNSLVNTFFQNCKKIKIVTNIINDINSTDTYQSNGVVLKERRNT